MAKLFDLLDDAKPDVPSAAQAARNNWYRLAANIRAAVREGVEAIARDAQSLGLNAVLTEMPPEVAKGFVTLLPIVQTLWENASDAVPFPELPADAPSPE